MDDRKVARRILLPRFLWTTVADESETDATLVKDAREPYFVRAVMRPENGQTKDGKPRWKRQEVNFFPVVLDDDDVPWAEAMIYLMELVSASPSPKMATYASIADDLRAYRRFIDEERLDWTNFPANKLERPTYRFSGHLKFLISGGEIAGSTARRRLGSVVGFYRWLAKEKAFIPENHAWLEKDLYLQFSDSRGAKRAKLVKTTDLKVIVPKTNDPYDGTIEDGAKLRPLPVDEQERLIDALGMIRNTEMTLIHIFALLTGARIQTVLTVRVSDILSLNTVSRIEAKKMRSDKKAEASTTEVRLPVGHGTNIDTKFDKQMVLHIPQWFFEKLKIYANSERARRRRARAVDGDFEKQYLFLSQRGIPFYQSKMELADFNSKNNLRHTKAGQAVRQFITERVIPYIRERFEIKDFHYRFHDLRATAGMNWTDYQLDLVANGKITLHEARKYVQVRMGHESSETTERYLKFRRRIEQVRQVEERHAKHLRDLCERAMVGDL
ncbi:site-specific integrase [Paraburkholderia caribensis]|uniref:site-specific integrase n=1 Tax=Paraburkholderia caribensis TaxID=75105 RepID=UPI00078DD4D6|nr:site-specific integrase [Paraburkholderia caribensis]AMV44266.1 hypothetical protein ATN79_20190 [Paraburkholderia caribensis]